MSDPFTEIVGLLKPSASFSKLVLASGAWAVRRTDDGQPFYCALLEGACRLSVAGEAPVALEPGDFALVPAARDFTGSSLPPPDDPARCAAPVAVAPGVFRLGDPEGAPDTRMLVGHCAFASPDAALLVSLLPRLVHVRGEARLATLLGLVNEETRRTRPGRDAVLSRLIEVMLIEALRAASGGAAAPGLLRGLADGRLAAALRRMHADPTRAWTVAALAREAALSRSTFFDRFRREVGVAPMDYLTRWRMALAKDLLRGGGTAVGRVAAQVGYSSASTFSVAFARHVGVPPVVFARGVV